MHKNARILKLFLGSCHRNLAELLELLHEFESGLASTCASGLVALNYLSLSILLECNDLSIDFFYKLFHFFVF